MENERGDYMLQVNRTNNLKILKDITNIYPKINTIDGKVNVKQAIAKQVSTPGTSTNRDIRT